MLETINSQQEVFERWDELTKGVRAMIRKQGDHGQTPDLIMYQMITQVGLSTTFLLVNLDEANKIDGIVFALAVTGHGDPWVEVVALWSKPGVATKVMYGAFDMLASWTKGLGASKMLAAVTRSPERFFDFFYSKLGFEKIGIIIERRV